MADFSLGSAELETLINLDGLNSGIDQAESIARGRFGALGDLIGGALNVGLVGAGAAVVSAVAGIGVAAWNVGSQVNDATNTIQAQLGVTRDEADALADAALGVFGNNWGNSIEDATASLIEVRQQMGGLADGELQAATEKALTLRDVFGVEVPESTNAANTLMQNFGLTSDQAFDFITKGFQNGLNASGDFLDTIGEYSTQFANGGADAGQFFSLLESGLQGGVLGTDKAADAFKEFRVRIQDGSTATSESLKALGIDADQLARDMASGQVTAADAFQLVVGKLNETDDANLRMQAGVGLLGTQFEDLGTDAALGLSMVGTSLDDMAGATDSLNVKYNSLGSLMTGVWRQVQVEALAPIGAILLDLANSAMPLVQSAVSALGRALTTAFSFLQTTILPALQTFASALNAALPGAISFVTAAFGDFATVIGAAFTTAQAVLGALLGNAGPIFSAFMGMLDGSGLAALQLSLILANIFGPELTTAIMGFVSAFTERIGVVVAFAQQAFPLIQSIVMSVFGIILGFLQQNGASIVATLLTAWTTIQGAITTVIGLVSQVVLTIFGAIASVLEEHSAEIQAVLTMAWQTIQQVIDVVLAAIENVIIPVLTGVAGFISSHGTQITGLLSAAWEIIKSLVTAALGIIQGVIQTVMSLISGDWSGAWEGIQQILTSAWQGIQGALSGALDLLKTTLSLALDGLKTIWSNLWNSLAGIVTGIGGALTAAGRGIVENIKQGILAAWDGLVGWFKGKLGELRDMLPFSPPKDKSSPLYTLPQAGQGIVEQIQAGITAAGKLTVGTPLIGLPSGLGTLASASGAGFSNAEARISIDDRGESWLRNLIRIEIADSNRMISQGADRRKRTS